MKHPVIQAAIGSLIGLVLGAAMIYGLVEFADWFVEFTHEFSPTR